MPFLTIKTSVSDANQVAALLIMPGGKSQGGKFYIKVGKNFKKFPTL